MPRFAIHRIAGTVPNSTTEYDFFFLAPPGSYDGISGKDLSGVTEVTSPDDVGRNLPITKVEALLRSSLATRRKLRIETPAGQPPKYKTVIVAQSKVANFETAVIGKTSDKGKVLGVVESLDAIYY